MAGRTRNRKKKEPISIIDVVSSDTDSSDLDSPISGLFKDQVSKHRTCWKHVFASLIVRKEKVTLEDIVKLNKGSPCLLEFPCLFHRGGRLKRGGKGKEMKELRPNKVAKYAVSRKTGKLDSLSFECQFENLWKRFSEDKRTSFAYLDSMWFSLYLKSSTKAKVLTWIKKKSILSKKYVIVPIVCWSHWNLLIFCNFSENVQSKTQKPCMLLLDSLRSSDPRRYEPDIRKFVLDIFKEEGRPEQKALINRIPLLVPEVPQQRDAVECGKFVLYFINLFMKSAPETFSIKDYPYFMKKDWFAPTRLDSFCQKLSPN